MKTIGLIGGMSWNSSQEYYRILNSLTQSKLGGSHSAKILLYSVDFAEIDKYLEQQDWENITILITSAAKTLEQAGCDLIAICTNTIHQIFDEIQSAISVPMYHIAEATGYQIKNLGIQKVGLLGTNFVMEGAFYRDYIHNNYGIDVSIPEKNERDFINSTIFKELVVGTITETARKRFKEIILKMKQEGAEGIILGCTEIPLIISENDSPIPIFNTTEIHANYLFKKALL